MSRRSPEQARPAAAPWVLFPLPFIAGLAAFGLLPMAQANPRLSWSFFGAAAVLLAWNAALFVSARKKDRTLKAHWVLRRPHWLQPIVQGSVYVYWGMHWGEVYDSAWMIVAQLVFAYAFDSLLFWSRGEDDYELGMAPFPIILSTNLFLWFKPDWFYLQFFLIGGGFAAKQLLRWTKDGRKAHIFNPSSFPLAVASIALIATGTVDHTWGREIAQTLGVPMYMFQFLFLISVPGQILFGVASMTMPAVVTAAALSGLYGLATGSYFFFGTIPTAAFLGMLLLFTDPSTAPKSELGRVLYGVLYGVSIFVLYGVLDFVGQPTFYDKLLFVPFLNLAVRALDRVAAMPQLSRLDPARLFAHVQGRPRYAGMTAMWAGAFALLLAVHAVGDTTPANYLPTWERACAEGRRNGCRNLATMEATYCEQGSGWACNELGLHALSSREPGSATRAAEAFNRSCALHFRPGCANEAAGTFANARTQPTPEDYNIVVEAKGRPQKRSTLDLWHWACEQGWNDACASAARAESMGAGSGLGLPSVAELERSCASGDREGCKMLGLRYRRGDGVQQDPRRAMACELGIAQTCLGVAAAGVGP